MHTPTDIIAIGELLWDVFPDQRRLGGAPANFAIHFSQLSRERYDVALASAVGNDPLGTSAVQLLEKARVRTDLIGCSARPTGQVNVTLATDGTPAYEIAADAAWDHIPYSNALASALTSARVVYFGTLAQRSPVARATIQKSVSATPEDCLRVLDINLRPTMESPEIILQSLELANVLKLSDEELPVLANQCALTGNCQSQLGELQQHFELTAIAYTRGEDGAILLRGDEVSYCSGLPTKVIDTVGAGDAFTAAFVTGLLEKRPLDEINQSACKIAAFVCSQNGATPKVPSSVLA